MSTATLNINDYISEEEKKEIAIDAFKEKCLQKFEEDSERIFSNSAYHIVEKMVDENFDNNLADIIKEKTIKVINGLSESTVFKRPDVWDKNGCKCFDLMQEVTIHNKELLEKRIREIINNIPDNLLEKDTYDAVHNVLDEKLFGGK